MNDEQIVSLFFDRSESALGAVQEKYGGLCLSTARRILPDARDAEECVNDVWMRVWNAIPPERPQHLGAYVARVTRNAAIDRYHYNSADKRSTQLTEAFEELANVLPSRDEGAPEDRQAFSDFVASFLRSLSRENRVFFVRYYWYGESVGEIARDCRVGEGKIKSSLHRTRTKMREAMEKEGIRL